MRTTSIEPTTASVTTPSIDLDMKLEMKPSFHASASRKRSASQVSDHDAGASVTAALNALQVSLQDFQALIPPTPAASPVHSRSSKRARFDFELDWDTVNTPKKSEVDADASRSEAAKPTALVSMSAQLERELARRPVRKMPSEHVLRARKRRSQLSYFAIAGAFHRAALERERAAQAVVE